MSSSIQSPLAIGLPNTPQQIQQQGGSGGGAPNPQMRAQFQAQMQQWQTQHPGQDPHAFFAQHHGGHGGGGQQVKSDYSQWIAQNPSGSVSDFAQAEVAQRQQQMQARGFQIPQAAQGGFLQRMTARIEQMLSTPAATDATAGAVGLTTS